MTENDRIRSIMLDTLEAVALTLVEHGFGARDIQELMDRAQLLAFREYDRRRAAAGEGH